MAAWSLALIRSLAIAALFQGSYALAQDACLPLLTVTGHDASWVKYTNSIESAAKNAFCDDRFLSRKNDSSFGLSAVIPIESVPLEFGVDSTSSDALEARSKFCQSASASFSQNTALDITKRIVSRDSLQKYVDCKKILMASESSISLMAQVLSDDYLIATASFTRRYPGQPYPKVAQFITKNILDLL